MFVTSLNTSWEITKCLLDSEASFVNCFVFKKHWKNKKTLYHNFRPIFRITHLTKIVIFYGYYNPVGLFFSFLSYFWFVTRKCFLRLLDLYCWRFITVSICSKTSEIIVCCFFCFHEKQWLNVLTVIVPLIVSNCLFALG